MYTEKELLKRGIPVTMYDMDRWYECTKNRHFKIAYNKAKKVADNGGKPLILWKGGDTLVVLNAHDLKRRSKGRPPKGVPVRVRSKPLRKRNISQVKR